MQFISRRDFHVVLALCSEIQEVAHRFHVIAITAGAIASISIPHAVTAAALGAARAAAGAAEHFFWLSVLQSNWLAANWLRFPRTQAAAGTAAVWPKSAPRRSGNRR